MKKSLVIAGLAFFALSGTAQKKEGVLVGTISYSFRSMPHDVDQLIEYCKQSHVNAVEMLGDPAETYAGKPKAPFNIFGPRPAGPTAGAPPAPRPAGPPRLTDEQRAQLEVYNKQVAAWRDTVKMDKFVEIGRKFQAAGIKIYAFKPNAFGANNSDAEVEYGIKAAKAMGATCVTLEMPTDSKQTQRLGDLGAKHQIYVGYHNHLQGSDVLWDEALAQSPWNTINIDAGHYIAAGGKNTRETLLAFIEKNHGRISSMHMKDRTTPEHGQKNLAWGMGDTPIVEILQLMAKNKYEFPVAAELEYEIPEGSNAVQELAKCMAYAQNALNAKK